MSEVVLHRCSSGHEYFYPHPDCPRCGSALAPVQLKDATAVAVAVTTVHVNPTGEPYCLALARLASGAATLCRIGREGIVTGDTVVLQSIDGIYHAHRSLSERGD